MGVSCQILINRPSEGFHRAGWPVAGRVKYALDVPTEFKDIVLALKGESYCSWSETDSDDNSTSYTGSKTHVSQAVSLLNGAVTKKLPPGVYEHKFLFTLPKNIPASIKTSTGYVMYTVALDFHRQRVFNAIKSFSAEIIVRSCLDVTLPDTPIVFGLDKTLFKPLSFDNQKIVLKAIIARPYIKPGERADLTFKIFNDSAVYIKGIRADLIRKTTYTADCSRQTQEVNKVKQCNTETVEVPPRSNAILTVAVPTSDEEWSVQRSSVISNEYTIRATVRLPVPHRNATVEMPILLGEQDADIPVEVGVDIAKDMEANILPPEYSEVVGGSNPN